MCRHRRHRPHSVQGRYSTGKMYSSVKIVEVRNSRVGQECLAPKAVDSGGLSRFLSSLALETNWPRRWMDQWQYWTVFGGHFASRAREDRNVGTSASNIRPTLDLLTFTNSIDQKSQPASGAQCGCFLKIFQRNISESLTKILRISESLFEKDFVVLKSQKDNQCAIQLNTIRMISESLDMSQNSERFLERFLPAAEQVYTLALSHHDQSTNSLFGQH